jgi:MoaA/NifB/PqqE/SkfB family radical SAM enzyme
MVSFFEERREEGYVHANMVGGEPYVHLKSDLLERLADTMPSSWITTSGVTRMKHIPNVMHFVSVDGGDAETHDRVRGFKGLHSKIIKNLAEARATGFFPAALHVTLNSQNYHQIAQILETWGDSGLVDGIAFSTHTSIEDAHDEYLRPTDEQKLQIVAELLRQKKQHGGFLLNTVAMTQGLNPDVMKKQTPETCATAQFVSSFHADGSKIEQCIFSDKADCSTCGCAVTLAINNTARIKSFDWETARMLRGLMPPFKQAAAAINLASFDSGSRAER